MSRDYAPILIPRNKREKLGHFKNRSGFTIIELIISVIVIAVGLIMVALFMYLAWIAWNYNSVETTSSTTIERIIKLEHNCVTRDMIEHNMLVCPRVKQVNALKLQLEELEDKFEASQSK